MFPTFILALIMSFASPVQASKLEVKPKVLSQHEFSLNDRYPVASVSNVFKDNILLTIAYASGKHMNPANIDWSSLEKPTEYNLVLKPGETFAFHDDVLPDYTGKISKTTNAHFNSYEGFKSDGYLIGDGVCHLASLLYWVAKDAGLNALAPTRHDFANIPEVPMQYGTSIYSGLVKNSTSNEMQNLYITNNKDKTVTFAFNYDGNNLAIKAVE